MKHGETHNLEVVHTKHGPGGKTLKGTQRKGFVGWLRYGCCGGCVCV